MKSFLIDFIVVVANLKDWLFTLFDPDGKLVNMLPFDKKLTSVGQKWVKKIKKVTPTSTVTFTGSASLELPGHQDIDIIIGTEKKYFYNHSKPVKNLLGTPYKKDLFYLEWRIKDKDVNVDVLMTDPENRMYLRIMDAHTVLRKYKHLYQEYKNLKQTMNGAYYKQFELKRAFLFNKIFYKYGHGLDFLLKKI